MENIVVDSSVAVKWYVVEFHAVEAISILSAYKCGDLDLLAPDLIYAEVGNIIWKKRVFQELPEEDALSVIHEFRRQPLQITRATDLLEDAYQLAVTHRRSVYDMIFLALSLREKCRFVTADERMVNAIGKEFPNVVWLADW